MHPSEQSGVGPYAINDRIEEALHAVLTGMPPDWHFVGVKLAHRSNGKYREGMWYANAVGPDPLRPQQGYGAQGRGYTMGHALRDLDRRMSTVRRQFSDNSRLTVRRETVQLT